MRKRTMLLLAVAMLLVCAVGVNAETHEHFWSLWDYYDSDTTYHYAQRYCYECGEIETKKEKHALMPNPSDFTYGSEDVCNAEYKCRICGNYVKVPTSHKWTTKISNWKWFSDSKHSRTVDKRCSQCEYWDYNTEYGDHNLGYHRMLYKGKPCIYYGCDVCNYVYNNRISNVTRTYNKKISLSRYYEVSFDWLYGDKIKSIKKTAGKKNIKIIKVSPTKIRMYPKKKGKAKFTVKLKSGVTRKYVFEIKK